MARDLRTELKQTKPFRSLQHEALLSIQRTAAVVEHEFEADIKPYGITATQYNVLRILRGAGVDGLCRNEIRDRMLRRVPDVTRLLDRLEEMALVTRARTGDDRRFVTTRITQSGLAILATLDPLVDEVNARQVARLDKAQLRTLIDLLAEVRDR
ncbi:MAG TPA: MarR family transcriptional regulator [Vicinamibacterales bacterium]